MAHLSLYSALLCVSQNYAHPFWRTHRQRHCLCVYMEKRGHCKDHSVMLTTTKISLSLAVFCDWNLFFYLQLSCPANPKKKAREILESVWRNSRAEDEQFQFCPKWSDLEENWKGKDYFRWFLLYLKRIAAVWACFEICNSIKRHFNFLTGFFFFFCNNLLNIPLFIFQPV